MVESEGKQQLKFQAQVKFPRLTTKYFKLRCDMGTGKPGLPVHPTRRSVTGLGVLGLGAPAAPNPGRVWVGGLPKWVRPGLPISR